MFSLKTGRSENTTSSRAPGGQINFGETSPRDWPDPIHLAYPTHFSSLAPGPSGLRSHAIAASCGGRAVALAKAGTPGAS